MVRKLASIQAISSLEKIDGADKISKATILGWELVVLKDEFKVGDKCVYCEVDSILPDKPEFEFLRVRKFRIKTIKLRGQVSQGICFPLSVLPKGGYNVGDDVTKVLGVNKYDPQAEAERKEIEKMNIIHNKRLNKYFMKYLWFRRLVLKPQRLRRPSFVKKTDEDRIQLFPNICKDEKGTEFFATEKLDGTSASYFVVKKGLRTRYGVCSRNFQLTKKGNVYWRVSDKLEIKKKLKTLMKQCGVNMVLLQGEIIGPKVQGNKYKLDELDFYAFNLKIGHEWYVAPLDITLWFNGAIKAVRQITGEYYLPETIPQAVETAVGRSVLADVPREGLVIRNQDKHMSFKIINPKFLLKYDE